MEVAPAEMVEMLARRSAGAELQAGHDEVSMSAAMLEQVVVHTDAG